MHQYIKVSGTPYERGFQYGSQAKERIHKVIEEYKVLFEKEALLLGIKPTNSLSLTEKK